MTTNTPSNDPPNPLREVQEAIDALRVHPRPSDILNGVSARLIQRRRRRVAALVVAAVAVLAGGGTTAVAISSQGEPADQSSFAADESGTKAATSGSSTAPNEEATTSVVTDEERCPLSTLGKDTIAKVSLPCAVGAEILTVSAVHGKRTRCADVTYRVSAETDVRKGRVCAGRLGPGGLTITP